MNLYLLSQDINNDYDTYDSCVVCAENEEEARKIHPSEYVTHYRDGKWYGTFHNGEEYEKENTPYNSWILFENIDKIKVQLIGVADEKIKKGRVLSSYNAG